MTEEQQQLVAQAALLGARFVRQQYARWGVIWSVYEPSGRRINKWSIHRAAEYWLWKKGYRTDDEHIEYDARTDVMTGEDVDPTFLALIEGRSDAAIDAAIDAAPRRGDR